MSEERKILEALIEAINIPQGAYEKAEKRYQDVGTWFSRPDSRCAKYNPHVYPQGSFRLGTAVRPLTEEAEYDLDLGCRLRHGITRDTHTQESLKKLVGLELQEYRAARQIKETLEEQRRCWRLSYADQLRFHMDVVPSIPETISGREHLKEAMVRGGTEEGLAARVANLSGTITDTSHPRYRVITPDWRVSNSEGYALWFESRMKLAPDLLLEQAKMAGRAQVDDLPRYRWKSPLQAAVQILKRHRDTMFRGTEGAPISVTITTLAGHAYRGERHPLDALRTITATMRNYVRPHAPRIPNPVNPAEDFTDKWTDPKYTRVQFEEKFWRWIDRVEDDFRWLSAGGKPLEVLDHVHKRLAVQIDGKKLGLAASLLAPAATPGLSFPNKPVVPSKPSGFA